VDVEPFHLPEKGRVRSEPDVDELPPVEDRPPREKGRDPPVIVDGADLPDDIVAGPHPVEDRIEALESRMYLFERCHIH